jgi:hypothetical protein
VVFCSQELSTVLGTSFLLFAGQLSSLARLPLVIGEQLGSANGQCIQHSLCLDAPAIELEQMGDDPWQFLAVVRHIDHARVELLSRGVDGAQHSISIDCIQALARFIQYE